MRMTLADVAKYHRDLQKGYLELAWNAQWAAKVGNEDAHFWAADYRKISQKHEAMAETIEEQMSANAELCGGPSGPSERAPGYASAPKTEE